jgi:hypothetical protein
MDMETAPKILQALSLRKLVQVDNTVMEMETVCQIQFLFLVKVDGKVIMKVVVFHYPQIHQPKFHLHKDVQMVNNQTEQEVVSQCQCSYHAPQDT